MDETGRRVADSVGTEVAQALVLGAPVLIAYEPGNMTRYEVAFVPLWNAVFVGGNIGATPDEFVVAVLNFRAAHPFKLRDRDGAVLHHSYIGEKLRMQEGDAVAMEALLAAVIRGLEGDA